MAITCGIDWAETHHDVALVDESGKLMAKRRISDDAEGYRRLCAVISAAQLAGGEKGRPVYDTEALADAHGGHWAVRGLELTPDVRVTLAHELTHTLDDEHFNLDKVNKIGDKHDTATTMSLLTGQRGEVASSPSAAARSAFASAAAASAFPNCLSTPARVVCAPAKSGCSLNA